MVDADGNCYIDFLQAGGLTIPGSNNESRAQSRDGLIEECGLVTGLLHEAELMIAKEIHRHMSAVEMFRMLGSGTEAVMASRCVLRAHRDGAINQDIKIGGVPRLVGSMPDIPGDLAAALFAGVPRNLKACVIH